jgi:hypothetical protein
MLTTADRVKRHRANRKMIRVEVEVPTPSDVLAVRRYAQARRQAPASQNMPVAPPGPIPSESISLDSLAAGLPPGACHAIRLFADALARAHSPELIARGLRIAANFRDLAESHAATPIVE